MLLFGGPRYRKRLVPHLENYFQLNRYAERKARHSINQAAWVLLFSEYILQQLRSPVSHFRLIAKVRGCGYRHAEPYDAAHFVQGSQMLPRDSEGVEGRETCGFAPRLHANLCSHSPAAFRG